MNLELPTDTEHWLRQRVAAGEHASLAEAIAALVAERQAADLAVEADDHLWAKLQIDEALAALDRGEGRPLDAAAARIKQSLAKRARS
jgi:Arc/MetJ-type ribon-helix-helix transcriptional regulator